jgi:hypothetical protein
MYFMSLGVDAHGASVGTHSISATVTAVADSQEFNGPFTITISGVDGTTLGSVSGMVKATRIGAQG